MKAQANLNQKRRLKTETEQILGEKVIEGDEEKETPKPAKPVLKQYLPIPPFQSRPKSTKRKWEDEQIMDTFCKVEVNIHLLDIIKQIPFYAKFLKELCVSKKELKTNESIKASKNISAILQKVLPPKCKDPEIFSIPCKLGSVNFSKAILDLGALVNVLPLSI